MDCRKINALLSAYLDGECSPEERRKVEEHLRRCPGCRSELELLRRIENGSRRTGPPDPGEPYWNTFLPRLRRRIDQEQPLQVPGGLGRRIRRLFAPPVPWIRLAGAVATAVLVVVIGRAFIDRRGDLVPMRSPTGQPPTDRVRPAKEDVEGVRFAVDSIAADRGKRALTVRKEEDSELKAILEAPEMDSRTAPLDEALTKKGPATAPAGEISGTGAEIAPAAEVPAIRDMASTQDAFEETPPPEDGAPTQNAFETTPPSEDEASTQDVFETTPPPADEGTHYRKALSDIPTAPKDDAPEIGRLMEQKKTVETRQAPETLPTVDEDRAEPVQRAIAPPAAGPDWRKQIGHWEAVIDTSSDPDTLAAAHLSLAESRYHLAAAEPTPDDISTALEANRDALKYAAGDSVRQLLEERISWLEDQLQKK